MEPLIPAALFPRHSTSRHTGLVGFLGRDQLSSAKTTTWVFGGKGDIVHNSPFSARNGATVCLPRFSACAVSFPWSFKMTCTVPRLRRQRIPSVTSRKAAHSAPWLFPLCLLQPPCHLIICHVGNAVLALFSGQVWAIRGQSNALQISIFSISLKRNRLWGADEAEWYWCCFACVVGLPASRLLGALLFPLLEPVKCLAVSCLVASSVSYLPDGLSWFNWSMFLIAVNWEKS